MISFGFSIIIIVVIVVVVTEVIWFFLLLIKEHRVCVCVCVIETVNSGLVHQVVSFHTTALGLLIVASCVL